MIARRGRAAPAGQAADQRRHAKAADLLVVAQREVQRDFERRGQGLRHHGEDQCDKPLHIGGAAPVKTLAAGVEPERVAGPGLPGDRHDIGVPGENDPAAPARTDRRIEVRLGALGVSRQHALDAEAVEIIGDPAD